MALRLGRRRIARPVRVALWSLVSVVAIIVVGAGVVLATFDPNSLKPRIIAAVKQATGRDLTLQGDIRLGLSLQPTLQVSGVSFSNPPGFSRPQMATLERLDLKLALLPLLSRRVEIDRLVLVKPDIVLEANAQGQPNWQFTPEPGAASGGSGGGGGEKTQTRITVADLRIQDGVVTLRAGKGAQNTVLAVKSLEATSPSPDANLHVAGEAAYNGAPFTLTADVGPLTRLQESGAGVAAWPVQLTMAAAGAKLTVDGSLKDPLQGSGYDLKVAATVPDLAALSVFAPGQTLPPLHDVAVAAQIADAGAGKWPQISGLTLHVGASDLTALVAGLKVDKFDIAAARLDQPVQVSGQGSFANAPAVLSGSVGAPDALLAGAQSAAPVPIDLSFQAAGSSLTVKGTVASGAGQRVALKADVKADTIDLDKLRGLFAKPAGAPASAGASAPASPAAPPVAKAEARGRLFPDTPIRFDVLRAGDADVTLAIATLKSGSAVYRSIAMHIVLSGGKLAIDPYSADLPEGHLAGSLSADATQAAPPVSLRLHAPALALAPLLVALGEPGYASGNLEVYADLHGAGATPHAIAAALDGSLGLAMVNGTVDNRVLGSTLEAVLREISLLDLVGRGGSSQIQCFAMRLDIARGIGTFRTLVLASSLLTMDGGGSVNLVAETLDMRIRAQARVAGTGVVVPLHASGSLRSPSATADTAGAVVANAGTVVGLLGSATPLGMVAGALAGQKLLGGGDGADCGPALAVARGQQAPVRQAGSAAPASPPAQQKAPNAGALLKQLFR